MNFYNWTFEPSCSDVWFLSEPVSAGGMRINAWSFKSCTKFEEPSEPLVVSVKQAGLESDAVFGELDIPYVSANMASALQRIAGADIQLVPVMVRGTGLRIFIVNALREIVAIDESRSSFTKWEPGNSVRPDKANQYRSFFELRIASTIPPDVHIFRPWGWRVALIVSEVAKAAIESVNAYSTRFQLVS